MLRKERLGDFETTVLKVSDAGWHKVMAEHRPGGVVRVQYSSQSAWGDRPLEQPYALANDKVAHRPLLAQGTPERSPCLYTLLYKV